MNHPYQHFQAKCDLKTKEVGFGRPLPTELTPAAHMEIYDLHKYVSTSLTRLESKSPRLRGIAIRSLMAVMQQL